MTLKECFLTQNDCYKKNEKIQGKPTGIVVHSTGANNKTLKRYVQPLKSDKNYSTILADVGTNKYSNDWNRPKVESGRSVCVHAFIGVNDSGKVETYQTLPFDICCWGCGSASKGSYNFNPQARIQFEICEDGLNDKTYFDAAFKEAIEFCAYLCKQFGFGVQKISSHAESHSEGYASNHGDCDYWLKKYGKSMDWFRNEVAKLLVDKKPTQPSTTPSSSSNTLYIVQAGAFSSKDNAKVLMKNLIIKGFTPYIVYENKLFKVRTGAFKVKEYAEATVAKMKEADFDSIIVTGKQPSENSLANTFSVGDKVKVKSGVTKFSNGVNMLSFVKVATLYVRAIENDGEILLVSTEKEKNIFTGRVKASDVVKV